MASRSAILIGAAAVALALFVSPATAGTLDQSQTNTAGGLHFGGSDPPQRAQTFTAGLTGELDQVDIYVQRKCAEVTSGIVVGIHSVQAGDPTDTSLAGANVPAANINVSDSAYTVVSVTFATPPPVTSGTQYAIMLGTGAPDCTSGISSGPYQWAGAVGNPYLAGSAFEKPGTTWNDATSGFDHSFKTYVLTAPPPGGGGGTGGGGSGGAGGGGGGTPVAPGQAAPPCGGKQTTIIGSDGPDQIAGTAAADVISALGGNDTVSALGGKDVVCGGPGKDTLRGGKGKDTLLGQKGKDKLRGGGGKDICKGGKGSDSASKCEVEKSI